MPLGFCGRLPELNLIPIQVIDPGKTAVGFIHSFGVDLYSRTMKPWGLLVAFTVGAEISVAPAGALTGGSI
jgi:hypothetical protein